MAATFTGTRLPTTLPAGVTERLTQHYGPPIRAWLADAPRRAVDVAERWDIDLHGFHDAGWTSVLAFGATSCGRAVMLKLVPSRSRFLAELASLTHWAGAHTCAVVRHDRTHHALLLLAVGHQAGGASRPADHQTRVAEALPSLHRSAAPSISVVPDLAESFARVVEPRLLASRHLPLLSRVAPVEAVTSAARAALRKPGKPVMLHADLYESNVLFDRSGDPVFIDPRGLRGPAAYDWAFWCAFYSAEEFHHRLDLAVSAGGMNRRLVLTWVAIVALDGFRHQVEVDDKAGARHSAALLRAPAIRFNLKEH